MYSPNKQIQHITEINAPIEKVWKALIDIDDWKWNEWTRLEASNVSEGLKGKLKASYNGDNKWETFDFTFGEVNPRTYILTWFGSVGPYGCMFSGYHTMRLEIIKDGQNVASDKTRLIHTEKFGGLLPKLNLGLPYDKLEINYLKMNESLKVFVEEK
uniref:Uncharacterized protein n=1 Tax=Eucampia antarctica TaxID=49252 RepID=A0A7S2S903_9STRA|mmetsp:Transcript_4804/g.4527  ORF Transcript_4804/g.4527 Transcript_4804/m.4527 type:complete len:157 (+) Transcript_4804:78-548(+)